MEQELIPHLFRTEFSKITAVLCKLFGMEHVQKAEDIASETFLLAFETWSFKGVPANPVAWLYSVARNKALNQLKRDTLFAKKISRQVQTTTPLSEDIEIDLSEKNITDSQLQMLFAICHPSIPVESQIGLALRILCGFGIEEIANAFLSNKEAINKRLFRAKEKLRTEKVEIALPGDAEIGTRLNTVVKTIYLLFSEGYYSESKDTTLRKDLCLEAMRLAYMLVSNELTDTPVVSAVLSLMCFHSSRFDARTNEKGEMILYADQDESLWNKELIARGSYYLNRSAKGDVVSRYHIEAAIAYWHTIKEDSKEKWQNILHLYDQLLVVEYSSVAALNRIYALSKTDGHDAAIAEAEALKLSDNHFYFTLLGVLYKDSNRQKALANFEKAYLLARTRTDRQSIQLQMDSI